MPTQKPKVTIRKVRRELPELTTSLEFARNLAALIRKGELDPVLDIIWNAADGRLRQYFQEDGNRDAVQEHAAEKIRMMRTAPGKLVVGHYYGIHGEKYESIRVMYMGPANETDNNGVPNVKVRVVANPMATGLVVGKIYKIPSGALDVLSQTQSELRSIYGEGGK